MTRYIKKEVNINQEINEVFEALISPSKIKQWWFAQTAIILPEVDGFYAATWGENEDDPDFITIATISEFVRPYKFKLIYEKYYSKDGPLPFEAKMEVTFVLEDLGEKTKLVVVQDGFPIHIAADEYYQGCVKGWDDTFDSLKNYLEIKEGNKSVFK